MQNLFFLVSCDYDMLLTKINFQIMLTLARTSHRPVRYTDASGILRNAGYKKSVDKEKRKYFVFHLERIALFKAKQGC